MVYTVDRCARVERRGWWLLSPAFMASRSARSPCPPSITILYNIQTLPHINVLINAAVPFFSYSTPYP